MSDLIYDYTSWIKQAIDNGNATALFYALEAISKLPDLTQRQYLNTRYANGQTPLMLAALSGRLSLVALLLVNTSLVEVDIPDHQGYTALGHAVASGYHLIIKTLLQLGHADPNKNSNPLNKTPLRVATENQDRPSVNLLLQFGANPVARDLMWNTPLMWAAKNGHLNMVNVLLEGCPEDKLTEMLNVRDHLRRSAKDWAHINGHIDIETRLNNAQTGPELNINHTNHLIPH